MTVTEFQFVPATKVQRKARIAIIGPAGCGKTMTGLLLAKGLGRRIAVIDTEHSSASLYSGTVAFQVLALAAPFTPARYIAAAKAAGAAGYDVLLVDSMSQEWNGEGGVLQMVEAKKTQIRNDFAAWNGPSQEHERFIQTVVGLPLHVISTFRSRTEYSMVTENGRTKVEKVGLGAITRDQAEYEYDLVLEMTLDHKAIVTKSRIPDFADQVIVKPGIEVGQKLAAWLSEGAPAPSTAVAGKEAPAPAPTAPVSMGIADPVQVARVQGLIKAALSTPEGTEERRRLETARVALEMRGHDKVTLALIARLSPEDLAETERLLLGPPSTEKVPF